MKTRLSTLIAVLFLASTANINAQTESRKEGVIIYEIQGNMTMSSGPTVLSLSGSNEADDKPFEMEYRFNANFGKINILPENATSTQQQLVDQGWIVNFDAFPFSLYDFATKKLFSIPRTLYYPEINTEYITENFIPIFYDDLTFSSETKMIAGYNCKKAVTAKGIILWYSPELKNINHFIIYKALKEGVVLGFEDNRIIATAKKVLFEPQAEENFLLPDDRRMIPYEDFVDFQREKMAEDRKKNPSKHVEYIMKDGKLVLKKPKKKGNNKPNF